MMREPLVSRDDDDDAESTPSSLPSSSHNGDNAKMHRFDSEETPLKVVTCFWLLGLLNNAAYVIMNASAKDISSGGVALVYLAGVAPGLSTKASSPFWFDRAGYDARLALATVLMFAAFALAGPVGAGNVGVQFLGVACCSAQSALGESSLLALASRYPRRGAAAVAAWSSGTGFAGVFGYAWVIGLSWAGLAEVGVQSLAMATLPPSFAVSFAALLKLAPPPSLDRDDDEERNDPGMIIVEQDAETSAAADSTLITLESMPSVRPRLFLDSRRAEEDVSASRGRRTLPAPAVVRLTAAERLRFAVSLWPVTGAIFAVYVSEYALQSGVWAAMGFPVSRERARDQFYEYANWLYQAGVLASRSSGLFLAGAVSKRLLWSFALAQALLLVFFAANAYDHVWDSDSIYVLCFVVGLFGGAVYVFGFRLIAKQAPPDLRELAMALGSFACDSGILLSNLMGLFIQACLYEANDIKGATVPMPFCRKT